MTNIDDPPPSPQDDFSVVYTGPIDLEEGGSANFRVLSLAHALKAAGANVHVLGLKRSTPPTKPLPHGTVLDGHANVGGRPPLNPRNILPTLWRALAKEPAFFRHYDSLPGKPLVIIYNTDFLTLLSLVPGIRKRGATLVLDVVDWYDTTQLPRRKKLLFKAVNAYSMKHLVRKANGLLVISTYLRDHYEASGLPTCIVPPLHHVPTSPTAPWNLEEKLFLSFAGGAGSNSRVTVENLARVVKSADTRSRSLQVDILGITEDQARGLWNLDISGQGQRSSIRFHGWVENSKARQLVAKSHFTVLQRPLTRLFEAGFPSKVTESLLQGTPVMGNITSDLGAYLKQGFNALITRDESADSLLEMVQEVLDAPPGKFNFDRADVKSDAARHFSPEAQGDRVLNFLKRVACSR